MEIKRDSVHLSVKKPQVRRAIEEIAELRGMQGEVNDYGVITGWLTDAIRHYADHLVSMARTGRITVDVTLLQDVAAVIEETEQILVLCYHFFDRLAFHRLGSLKDLPVNVDDLTPAWLTQSASRLLDQIWRLQEDLPEV